MMQSFANITEARNALLDFRAGHVAELSDDLRSKIRDLSASPSPVDEIVRVGELLYARRAEIDDAGRDLAGALIGFATINAWHGLLDDDRGDRIVQALRRDLGETPPAGMSFPKPADDVAPRAEYAAPVAPPAAGPTTPTP